jgi:hypothetical protein
MLYDESVSKYAMLKKINIGDKGATMPPLLLAALENQRGRQLGEGNIYCHGGPASGASP